MTGGRSTSGRGAGRVGLPWRELRWAVVGVALVAGLVLGWIGLHEKYASAPGPDPSALDLFYDDLKMLGFGGAPAPPLPWELAVARFLLPIAFGFAAFAALFALFRDRARLIRLPFLRGHVIIVGLGGKGLALSQALRASGARVVAIELEPASPALAPARRAGVIVMVGDATDSEILRIVGASRARYLVATADDGVNAEVALAAQRLPRSSRALECLVHVVDPALARLLRRDAFAAGPANVRVDFFSLPDLGARVLLDQFFEAGTRLVVVGLGPTTERVVIRALSAFDGAAAPSDVLVVDPAATARVDELRAGHPWVADRVQAADCPLDAPHLLAAAVFPAGAARATALVFLEDPSDTLRTAMSLRDAARAHDSTVVAALSRPGALAQVIDRTESESESRGTPTLRAVSLIEAACTAELITGGVVEQIARAVHEAYVRKRREGDGPADDPVLVDWDALPEAIRGSNRDQAAHIAEKLRLIGGELVVADDPRRSEFTFSPEELEQLARMEHDRWVAERRRDGWRLGPERDLASRTTPHLVGWEALVEDVRELDREAVREIPALVSLAGFEIVRMPASTGRAP